MAKIEYRSYVDKVLGGWIGKSLGGIIGAPVESHKMRGDFTAENCWPDRIYPNDDLDIQVVWMEMMEEIGPVFSRDRLEQFWRDRCWYNFAEYGNFLYNAERGIHAPLSGDFNNPFYRECMGCPIRSEIWSMVLPGNPERAAQYAKWDGELDHVRNSVHAEQFWAACGAQAFVAQSLEECFAAGRAVIPADCAVFAIEDKVRALYASGLDWKEIWRELVRAYGHRDGSKVEVDFAFTLLALYEGKGDVKRTVVTAVNCGWDTDCTAATAGALLGILHGSACMPEDWTRRMGDRLTCDVNVRHREATLVSFAEDTALLGLEASLTAGGATFSGCPAEAMNKVQGRVEKRVPIAPVLFRVEYGGEPVLRRNGESRAVLVLECDRPLCGRLRLRSEAGMEITPGETDIRLAPGRNEVAVSMRHTGGPLWDRNLVEAEFSTGGERYAYEFGFAGCREWKVYGPYWDAWDTSISKICPYRNDKLVTHPVNVDGCQAVMVHNFVRLDKPYLDEARLVAEDILEERPVLVERGEDFIDSGDAFGFVGEDCRYYVRDVVCRERMSCLASFGMTAPCRIWIDGAEVYHRETECTWGVRDFETEVRFDGRPKRFVIKVAKNSDTSRISMAFIKLDVPGDKMRGESYLISKMGEAEGNV